jgi:ABC-type antimicrobial peptide transport system permease subunit
LKTLWSRRSIYSGIFVEQSLVAVILMMATVSVVEAVKKYKSPGMLNVENTFFVGYMFQKGVQDEVRENVIRNIDAVINNLRQAPCVEAVSRNLNLIPYLRSDEYYSRQMSDSIRIGNKRVKAVLKMSDEFGASILRPNIEEGAWLENRPLPDGSAPAVITRQLADAVGWQSAAGKKIIIESNTHTVVGVVAGLKQEAFTPSPIAVVLPQYVLESKNKKASEYLVRIKPGTEKEFAELYYKEFRRLIVSDEKVEPLLNSVQQAKGMWVSMSTMGIVLQAIPTLFLFIFAFIGTFGLYWMTSLKRLKEFALRIALGSTKSRLTSVVIGESMLLTGIAIVPALLLSIFIYEYTPVHLVAVGITVFTMLLFSAFSAWYPAARAARVDPAEALHYE